MNSIISSFGIVLHAIILAEGKYMLIDIEKQEGIKIQISWKAEGLRYNMSKNQFIWENMDGKNNIGESDEGLKMIEIIYFS